MGTIDGSGLRGAGGDGGKIFIFAETIQGDGKILADGGDGAVGGKGGEVSIVTKTNNFSGEISTKGGKADIREKKKEWYERPLTKFALSVLGAVLAAGIIYWIGWN
jgi:hypothetical protein